jgi:hypothetical protein
MFLKEKRDGSILKDELLQPGGTPRRIHKNGHYFAMDITEVLRNAMRINVHRTGIEASEVSARSLRAGGAMALLHG